MVAAPQQFHDPCRMSRVDAPRASIPSGMISLIDFDRILQAAQTGQLTVAGPISAAELKAYVQVCIRTFARAEHLWCSVGQGKGSCTDVCSVSVDAPRIDRD